MDIMNLIYGLIVIIILALIIAGPFILAYLIYRLIKGQKKQTEQAQHMHEAKITNTEADFQHWKAERESRQQ